MFYAIIFAVVVLVGAGIGYTFGVSKRDAITKTRDRQYKELVREIDMKDLELLELKRLEEVYGRALRDIARGQSLPEVTATIALKDNN